MTPHNDSLPPNESNLLEKICTRCKELKGISDFSRDHTTKDGVKIYCRECISECRKLWPRIKHSPPNSDAYFVCSVCGISKIVGEFHKSSGRTSGIRPDCKECAKIKSRKVYADNREIINERARAFRNSNLDKIKEQIRNRPSQNPEYKKSRLEKKLSEHPDFYTDKHLRLRHGITQEWYDKTLAAQHGVCAICGASDPGGKGRFAIDHDHSCLHPKGGSCDKCRRGLLCMRCNLWIERLESTPGIAKRAIAYLNKYRNIEEGEKNPPLFI